MIFRRCVLSRTNTSLIQEIVFVILFIPLKGKCTGLLKPNFRWQYLRRKPS